MTTSFLLNPARAPKLDAQGRAIKKKYTVYGWLRNRMDPYTFASGKTVINGSVRRKNGSWQDFTINPTNMAKVQAAIAAGTLDTSKPVTLWGEFYQTSKGKRVMEVLSIQNALSDEEFKARNEARRAERLAAKESTPAADASADLPAPAAPTDLDDEIPF